MFRIYNIYQYLYNFFLLISIIIQQIDDILSYTNDKKTHGNIRRMANKICCIYFKECNTCVFLSI